SISRLREANVVPFLLTVVADRCENEQVRIFVLRHLRNGGGPLRPDDRKPVAKALADLLDDGATVDLRLQAAVARGEFARIDGVVPRLAAVCLAQNESLDLRYAAFTSLERAGPTAESIALLEQLATDETLGHTARNLLSLWHVE